MAKISFLQPLAEAGERTGTILFRQFNPVKWLVIGFAAWLAYLFQQNILPTHLSFLGGFRTGDMGSCNYEWQGNWVPGVLEGVVGFVVVCLILFVVMVFGLVMLWLNSRAKLVFLDNVVNNRANVASAWHEWREEGNSLFYWRLVFFAFLGALAVLLSGLAVAALFVMPVAIGNLAMGVGIAGAVLITLAVGYTFLYLEDFVIPLMWRDRVRTSAAWRKFLGLWRKHWLAFLFYGVFRLFLCLVINIVVGLLALVSCCCCCLGLVLLIPYIGTVVLLPVYTFVRLFSVAFLGQFGEEYELSPCLLDITENV